MVALNVAIVRAALGRVPEPSDVLLAIEVAVSTLATDTETKRLEYARAGVPHYWVVDPTARTLTVLELDRDAYREAAIVAAGTTWKTEEPFPMSLDPAEFV